MDETANNEQQTPRVESGRLLLIAGLGERFAFDDTLADVPNLWQRFGLHLGHVPGQVGRVTYGVCYNADDSGLDYIAGVEVSDFSEVPEDFARLRISAQRYAVFTHEAHVSSVRDTIMAIFDDWLPRSGLQPADAPLFERYDERFDPGTGMGGFEIWVPVMT